MIGKIQRVPLRDVWKHEAYDFTKWFQENLDVLNDVLDFTLSSAEREKSTGKVELAIVRVGLGESPRLVFDSLINPLSYEACM